MAGSFFHLIFQPKQSKSARTIKNYVTLAVNHYEMRKKETISPAQRKLTAYLEAHHMRKTGERFAILAGIEAIKSPFDADTLYRSLRADGERYSRATIYNTLELLERVGILRKLLFDGNVAHYELTASGSTHHHLVCTECGAVSRVEAPELHRQIEEMTYKGFSPANYNLYVYGICAKCAKASRRHTISIHE